MKKPIYLIFEKRESWLESIASDLVTYSLLLLCVFVSSWLQNILWTVLTVFLFFFALTQSQCMSKWIKIYTKDEAIDWAKNLED